MKSDQVMGDIIDDIRHYDFISIVSMFATLFLLAVADYIFRCSISGIYSQVSANKKRLLSSLFSSAIHAILVTSLAVYALLFEEDMKNDHLWGKSRIASSTCSITVGYMIGDLIHTLVFWKDLGDWFFVGHHTISASAYLVVTHTGVFRHMAMIRLLAEFSTVPVNLRYFLYELGLKDSKIYWYNGFVMLSAFFACRILILPYIYYTQYGMITAENFHTVGLLGQAAISVSTLGLDSLNLIWFRKMVRGCLKMIEYKKQTSRGEPVRAKGD